MEYQERLHQAIQGEWFECELMEDQTDSTLTFAQHEVGYQCIDPEKEKNEENESWPYKIADLALTTTGDSEHYYFTYTSDELTVYGQNTHFSYLRMNSKKMKEFQKGKKLLTGTYVLEDSLTYGDRLTYFKFAGNKLRMNLDIEGVKNHVFDTKLVWDGHGFKLTLGDITYNVYTDGENRILSSEDITFRLIPATAKQVKDYKESKKIRKKDGKKETRSYIYQPEFKDIVKYIKLSMKCSNNIVLADTVFIDSYTQPTLFQLGTYGDCYSIRSDVKYTNGKITLGYDSYALTYNCESDLAIAYRNEKNQQVTILKSTVDKKNHTITANYRGQGTYQLVDRILVKGGTHDKTQENPNGTLWAQTQRTGDIIKLIDWNYLWSGNGHFKVATPSQLATAVYYANTRKDPIEIELLQDIDLSQYVWAPMGWTDRYNGSNSFHGTFIGNHHKITGLQLASSGYSVGFIGIEGGCAISDLTIEDAKISGLTYAGILVGQAEGGYFNNCKVSGSIEGPSSGAMFGYEYAIATPNCTSDVMVNGEKATFLSWSEQERSKIVIPNPIQITIDAEHKVTRTKEDDYEMLHWTVCCDGQRIAGTNAEKRYEYQCYETQKGTYEIFLEALVSGQFVTVSNKLMYTIE